MFHENVICIFIVSFRSFLPIFHPPTIKQLSFENLAVKPVTYEIFSSFPLKLSRTVGAYEQRPLMH